MPLGLIVATGAPLKIKMMEDAYKDYGQRIHRRAWSW